MFKVIEKNKQHTFMENNEILEINYALKNTGSLKDFTEFVKEEILLKNKKCSSISIVFQNLLKHNLT